MSEDTLNSLYLQLHALQTQRDSILAMLRRLEWCRTEWSGTRGSTLNHYCPACTGTTDEGHSPDCELARLLQKGETTPCAPSASTDELRARHQFRPETAERLSPSDVADLLVYHAAGEISGGAFRQMTGLDPPELLYEAQERASVLWLSYQADEERRFQASRKSSKSGGPAESS